jgi:hypothetical protein
LPLQRRGFDESMSKGRATDPRADQESRLLPEHSGRQKLLPPPKPQTADSNKILARAELPGAQSASLRPIRASPPWSSPNNTKILILLQRSQYFSTKNERQTMHHHHELLLCLPLLLFLSGRLPVRGTPMEQRSAGP